MIREILEAKGKWRFDKSNPGMSGSATITLDAKEFSVDIGWNSTDKEFFASVTNDDDGNEEWAARMDGQGGFEDRMGPQGDYSGVDYSDPSLAKVVQAVKQQFGAVAKKKDLEPLIMASVGY